jgi:transcription elongation factor Elf1
MIRAMTVCQECGHSFELNSSLVKKEMVEVKGDKLWLTYFNCPRCNKRHFVQVDNAETNGLLVDITKQMASISKSVKQGKSVKKKSGKYAEASRYLDITRNQLMRELTGEKVYVKSMNQSIVLEFSDVQT